eukprot:TRINITY_DN4382_c0_g2_i1.p1 TRINITY_DN4382_c0_g2~~TRINITY_DN4382_c0_g2_i1.p1  ORF type:complete len:991 (+),score=388.33 TRINITY_DN4382_c0_g2_i1:53-2974(+)
MAPPNKKQKTEEDAAAAPAEEKKDEEMKPAETEKKEEPKVDEELEKDAPAAKGAKVKEPVTFLTPDTTMNVMTSSEGNLLMALSDGGIRHLLAGARASVGLKSGRYMFEAKIIEKMQRAEDSSNPATGAKSLVKIGFSTAKSSLLLGDSSTDVCFDSDGGFSHEKKRKPFPLARFDRDQVVAVLLNLDTSSENANTISLFKDGKRITPPQPLPESLHGQTLYPTVTYRNVSVQCNFGPVPIAPLPFTCTMVAEASQKDAEVTVAATPKDGKYEVLYPVFLPDEGGFDWIELFKEKHSDYTELSDRAIVEWCQKSGISGGRGSNYSNDKPALNFTNQEVADGSIGKMIRTIAPLQQRNYVVMELKSNLIKEERSASLASFTGSFKKVAQVMVGEPNAEFKAKTHELLLQAKQSVSDIQFRMKKAEETRRRAAEKRKKEAEKAAKKREKELKKVAAAKAKAEAAAKAKAEGKEVEEKEEEPEEEKEEPEEEVVEEPVKDEEPPKATLDDEEKKINFRKLPTADLTSYTLSTNLAKFTMPEKAEGFDDVKFEWSKGAKATEYVKKWVLNKKQTTPMEDLQPSAWFAVKAAAWAKALEGWQRKQTDYRAVLAKKASAKILKEQKKAVEEKAAAAKAAAAAVTAAKEEEKKEEEKPAEMEVEETKEETEVEVNFEDIDIFGVEDVNDVGGGMPLFKDFTVEDWALMDLSYQLHLLSHAFKKDCNDPERGGVRLDHLGFYYNKYYKKTLAFRNYGVSGPKALLDLAKEYISVEDTVLESCLECEMENSQVFVKIAEEARRHRAMLIDMGEETARLRFSIPREAPVLPTTGAATAGKATGGKAVKAVSAAAAVARIAAAGKAVKPVPAVAAVAAVKGGKGTPAVTAVAAVKGGLKGQPQQAQMPVKGAMAGKGGFGKAAFDQSKGKGGFGKSAAEQWGKGGKGATKSAGPYPTQQAKGFPAKGFGKGPMAGKGGFKGGKW